MLLQVSVWLLEFMISAALAFVVIAASDAQRGRTAPRLQVRLQGLQCQDGVVEEFRSS